MSRVPSNIFESYDPVQVGDWGCKVSRYSNQFMVFMWHLHNLDCQCEFFESEYDAVLWMEYMSAKYV